MKKIMVVFVAAILVVLSACSGGSETEKEIDTIVFADAGWDSIRVHNSIAQTIIEEGYGYDTDVTAGSTAATFEGLRQGDITVYMEAWTDNIKEVYEEALEAGDIEEVSVNFDDNDQGLYVPTYVIEGDEERDIEPVRSEERRVGKECRYERSVA